VIVNACKARILKLDLSEIKFDTATVFEAIAKHMPQLTHFTFRDGRVINYSALSKLHQLEFLDLCRYVQWPLRVAHVCSATGVCNDNIKEIVEANPDLVSLNLFGCGSISSWQIFEPIRISIRHLNLGQTSIDITHMGEMPCLQVSS